MSENFAQLGVTPYFIKKLEERGITKPTEIQRKIIARLSAGESVFFSSATGTGKTFAYLLPFLEKLLENAAGTDLQAREKNGGYPVLLIAAPTLELCSQISGEIDFLIKGTAVRSVLAIGSANPDRQIESLKKIRPQIITGNPNRLLVLAQKKIIKFDSLRFLVLDEADRLTGGDMSDNTGELCGMIIKSAEKLNNKIIITACSATLNKKQIEKLPAFNGGKNIPFVKSDDHEILREKIEHWAVFSEKRRKDQTLRSLLSALKAGKGKKTKIKVLVFTSRGDEAGLVLSRLQHHHVSAAGLIGKINRQAFSGRERKDALDAFRRGGVEVLVSTDLAARGLDIEGITHIVALDVPSDSEIYIHRCGRTARAGKYGTMITIGNETQMRLLASLEKKLKIRVQPKELHYGKITAPVEEE